MASFIESKQKVSQNLNGLITYLTSFQEGSPEFKKIERKVWSDILYRSYPTVSRQKVRHTIDEFVEKFKIHGFPQKARNLELLCDHYLKLEYFRESAEREDLQWILLDFLIKLSNKPTACFKDDKPITVPLTVQEEETPGFDWVAYLKEGSEKFRLPPSDDENDAWRSILSDETSREEGPVEEPLNESHGTSTGDTSVAETEKEKTEVLPVSGDELPVTHKSKAKKELALFLELENWLEKNFQVSWWRDLSLKETPKSKNASSNYCFKWEDLKSKSGKVEEVRVLSTFKVLRELVMVLARPWECYIILKLGDKFLARDRVSVSSLSHERFSSFLNSEICPYLNMVLKLSNFCEEILKAGEVGLKTSLTYWAYAEALQGVLNTYRKTLGKMQKEIMKQDDTWTLLCLVSKIRPWLRHIKFLYNLYNKTIPKHYKQLENWICAARLITVLYEEIPACVSDWDLKTVLEIFLKSIHPYMTIIGTWLSRGRLLDQRNEFIITRPSENSEIGYLVKRPYKEELEKCFITKTQFLDSIAEATLRAGASLEFLALLEKYSASRESEDSLFLDILKTLEMRLSDELPSSSEENMSDVLSQEISKENKEASKEETLNHNEVNADKDILFKSLILPFSSNFYISPSSLVAKAFESYRGPQCSTNKAINKSSCPVNELFKKLDCHDLFSQKILVEIHVIRSAEEAIMKRMKPRGFAKAILFEELELMDHLKAIQGVFFLRTGSMHLFTSQLFEEIRTGDLDKLKTVAWSCKLRDTLNDYYPSIASKFSISIGPFAKRHHISELDIIEQISLTFQPVSPLDHIITEEAIKEYNSLLQFFLKQKSALYILLKLNYRDFEWKETITIRRLYSLRFWLLHTLNCLQMYFTSLQTTEFEQKIVSLCEQARDLHTITTVHREALESWKKFCFLTTGHPCAKIIQKIFRLSEELRFLWKLAMKSLLADYRVASVEEAYEKLIKDLLHVFNDIRATESNKSFGALYDEILYNTPSRNT